MKHPPHEEDEYVDVGPRMELTPREDNAIWASEDEKREHWLAATEPSGE